MSKLFIKLLLCAVIAAIPVFTVSSAYNNRDAREAFRGTAVAGGALPAGLESFIRLGFPLRRQLVRVGQAVEFAAGRREIAVRNEYPATRNGIFAGSGRLMKNIDPPVGAYVEANVAGIAEFSENMRRQRKQTCVMLIPTSGAVLRQNLPRYAQSVMVNQRRFIENVYGRVSANATTIDVYAALIERQAQYIYYRTEDNLTPLGGYYVYSAMLSRLGLERMQLNRFEIEYVNDSFYGDMYKESGYTDAMADTLSLYRYSAANRNRHEFLVTHYQGGYAKTYHTLFPSHAATLGHELDVYLGGLSAVTDIRSNAQYPARILIFGDKTAISYLPFLANSCTRVTFIDLNYDRREFGQINPLEYDFIVFAYGIESFMHTDNPSRAVAFLEE